MLISSIPQMVVSSKAGWPQLERLQPSLSHLLFTLVIPLLLLPPVMLYYVGTEHGDAFVAGYGSKSWGMIATVFFLAEATTLVLMGWFIKQVAAANKAAISTHDAYMLACIAPIPLWLSSLGLLVPSLAFNVGVSLVALAATSGLIYHGVYALCRMHDEVTAAGITQTVMGAGLAGWALLLVLILSL
jgi:hypothetical protein